MKSISEKGTTNASAQPRTQLLHITQQITQRKKKIDNFCGGGEESVIPALQYHSETFKFQFGCELTEEIAVVCLSRNFNWVSTAYFC